MHCLDVQNRGSVLPSALAGFVLCQSVHSTTESTVHFFLNFLSSESLEEFDVYHQVLSLRLGPALRAFYYSCGVKMYLEDSTISKRVKLL